MSDYSYDAVLVDVHDGDTVTLDVDLGFSTTRRMHVRLFGINSPEMSTDAGMPAREHLRSLLRGPGLVLMSIKDRADKYGDRYLGILWIGNKNMNQQMVDDGFAKSWDGKGVKPV